MLAALYAMLTEWIEKKFGEKYTWLFLGSIFLALIIWWTLWTPDHINAKEVPFSGIVSYEKTICGKTICGQELSIACQDGVKIRLHHRDSKLFEVGDEIQIIRVHYKPVFPTRCRSRPRSNGSCDFRYEVYRKSI